MQQKGELTGRHDDFIRERDGFIRGTEDLLK
jgi:hypothetical protein